MGFVGQPNDAGASTGQEVDLADAGGVENEPLINSISDQATLGYLRAPDAATGPFGAVAERDAFSRPTHVQTARVEFAVQYAADGEIGTVNWKSGQTWQRQADGRYDVGGEPGFNLRIEPRSGVLTWQNANGQMCCRYPDGTNFVEGLNRARKNGQVA